MLKHHLSFILSLIATVGLLALAWFKGTDISIMLPTIVTGYVIGRAGLKASHAWSASRDPAADTKAVIEKLEGQ